MAEGGAAAAMANVRSEDNWKVHFRDTMRGGKMHNNWRMAQIHAEEASHRIRELEAWGALFDRTPNGRINQRPFGGHTYARLAHVGDRTGLEIIRVLQDKGIHGGIEVFMECTVISLPVMGGRVAGALAYWRKSGQFIYFGARAVVLATGGIGRAWEVTSNSWEYTGDGHALAYDAGADLIDMEFVQFHPTGMVWPPSVKGILVTEGVRGEGGVLKNSEGRRFMFDYIPEIFRGDYAETEKEADAWARGDRVNNRRPPELLTRDVVARAILAEVSAGRGSPHGGVFLDIASKRSAGDIRKKLPSMHHQFRELAGVDITKKPMEVGPTTHYTMGGIKVDAETQAATVPGLFAAGECSGGMHGANRLGGNSLSDLLVFGGRAGAGAAEHAKYGGPPPKVDDKSLKKHMDEVMVPFFKLEGENPFTVVSDLQRVMQSKVGIIRDGQALADALAELRDLRRRAAAVAVEGGPAYNPGWNTFIDLRSMLTVSEMVARAGLERTESRGAHTRNDHPDSSSSWERTEVVIRRQDEQMVVERRQQPELPDELRKIIEEGA
jgi:succinate dehydrogenase / fumarate reductase flavoprotein subunit